MASPTVAMSPFSSAVVSVMRKLYPESLADSSFDNTGLLLEAPHRPHLKNSVLLTIDLTKAVADEAIARKDSIIVAYHPIIFRGLKSFTLANTQQNSLLRLAQEGISVYCPHTALDVAPGGINDWLEEIVTTDSMTYTQPPFEASVITPVKNPPEGWGAAGYGRIVRFQQPVRLSIIVSRISDRLLTTDHNKLSVAVPQSVPKGQKSQILVKSIGMCAGSGGSMLNGLDVDLLFTGELSHHEALAAIEQGKSVITVFHSNSERLFLHDNLRGQLGGAIAMETGTSNGDDFQVEVSNVDRDPFEIIDLDSGLEHW